jgi:tetratricopeptide (TPR) repeat protein
MTLRSLIAGSIISLVALLAQPLAAQQDSNSAQQPQQNPPSQNSGTQNSQKNTQPKKSTAQENPFPEAQSEAAAHQSQQQDNSGSSNPEPNAPQPQNSQAAPQNPTPNKTADQNPFPEAQSEKAAHQGQEPDNSTPPSNGDQDYSSSRVKGLDLPAADPNDPDTASARANPASLPYNPKLARKDAEIGDYYLESGNFKGAYERFTEANRSDPGNAEAVYGLGESARRLNRRDEALRNYRLYLAALPRGPHAKEIRKAMKEMGVDPAS